MPCTNIPRQIPSLTKPHHGSTAQTILGSHLAPKPPQPTEEKLELSMRISHHPHMNTEIIPCHHGRRLQFACSLLSQNSWIPCSCGKHGNHQLWDGAVWGFSDPSQAQGTARCCCTGKVREGNEGWRFFPVFQLRMQEDPGQ